MADGKKTKPARVKAQWMGHCVTLTVTPEAKTVVVTAISLEEAQTLIDELQQAIAPPMNASAAAAHGVVNIAERKK